jgi:prepilin-type N-terminal cleavage/methylation domain-containing protein
VSRRGFTLLEMMIVVAIVGVMASLSGYGLTQAVRTGRANAAADLFSSVIREARVRAVSEQCTQFVQLNGPTYSVGGNTGPYMPATAYIVRKGLCTSTTMTYEQPGAPYDDVLVDTTHFIDQQVDIAVTAGVVPGDALTNTSLIIGYNNLGQRFLASGTAGAFTAQVGLGVNPLNLTITPHDPTISRIVQVPPANSPTLN